MEMRMMMATRGDGWMDVYYKYVVARVFGIYRGTGLYVFIVIVFKLKELLRMWKEVVVVVWYGVVWYGIGMRRGMVVVCGLWLWLVVE